MEQVRLTEKLPLSRLAAGCMRIAGARMQGHALLTFVQQCIELGINTFDHAPVYGANACEKLFGDAVLRKVPSLRDSMKLVTKAGIVLPGTKGNSHIYYDSRKVSLLAEIDGSLDRLGTDHVDLLLVHRPDPLCDPKETSEALELIVKQGKALHVGVSNYSPAQFDALQSYLSLRLVTNQLEFSVNTADNFFNGVSDHLFTCGVKPMAWSPLGGGHVFSGTDAQSVRLREVLSALGDQYGVPMDAIMYSWLFVHPLRMIVVTGTTNIERIRLATDALDIKLTYDEWYTILAASRGYDVP
jgi:predicted oxidoreductase